MYEYIKGKVVLKKLNYVALDVNDIAYKIYISLNTCEKIDSEVVKLFIYTYLREDAIILYGFYEEEERDVFAILININGVGPKLAMAILSTYSIYDFKFIIEQEDVAKLVSVPGLGQKKAQKLILDVKDKIKNTITKLDYVPNESQINLENDITLALQSLGYNNKEIRKVLEKENIKNYTSLEVAVKEILRKLNKEK